MKLSRLFAEFAGVRKARRLAAATVAYTLMDSVLGIDDYKSLTATGSLQTWITGLSGRRITTYLYPVVARGKYVLREIDEALSKYVAETYMVLKKKLFASDQEIMDQLAGLYDYANLSIAASLLVHGAKPVIIYPFGVLASSGIDISDAGSLEELIAMLEGTDVAYIAALIKKYDVSPEAMPRIMFSEFSRHYHYVRKRLNHREKTVLDAFTDLSLVILAYTLNGKDAKPPLLNRIDWGVLSEAYTQGLENALANTYYSEYSMITRDLKRINNTMTVYHQALSLYVARLASETLLTPLSLEPVLRAIVAVTAEALYTRFLIELVISGLDTEPLMDFLEKWWFR